MALSTTSLDSLPMSGGTGSAPGQAENVKIPNPASDLQQRRSEEEQRMFGGPPATELRAPPSTVNELVTGLQSAAQSGATDLPARDVPRDTQRVVVDEEVKPNYVPRHEDYISAHNTREEQARARIVKEKRVAETKEVIYDELHTPIMLAALYFMFQLPFVRLSLSRAVPAMFAQDGNLNIYGYVGMSLLFGGVYYGLSKATAAAAGNL